MAASLQGPDGAPDNKMASVCACYLINLDRAQERLARLDAQLCELRIPYVRVVAVDARALSPAEIARLTAFNRYYKPLIPGEVACYLSHLRALRRFLDSGERYALILEDDAVLPAGLQMIIEGAIDLRERDAVGSASAWDVLKLQNSRRRRVTLARLAPEVELVEYGFSVPVSAAAAVWTHEGARRFVDRAESITRPIDCDLQHPWEFGLTILSVHPPLVRTQGVSFIGSRKKHRSRFYRKLAYEARRFIPKLRHFAKSYGACALLRLLWCGHAAVDARSLSRADTQ